MKNFHAPIPTYYEGVTYRSRLEARWAVFFEHLDFAFEYECQSLSDDKGRDLYVPDFTIFDGIKNHEWVQHFFIEVKPLPPSKQYLDYIMSLPIDGSIELFIVVGEPSFWQPDGYWLVSQGTHHTWQKGFKMIQCRYCSRYNPSYLRSNWDCECNDRKGAEKPAQRIAKNYRFDLENQKP